MHIILGISGGISAYKIPELIRILKRDGHTVSAIMTEHAHEFVTETTIATVSESPINNSDPYNTASHINHERQGDIFVVAPATANQIAKYYAGIADDALSTAFLTFTGPKLICPAMHTQMWENPITQRNIAGLDALGVKRLGPFDGELACGDSGQGRMAEPALIASAITNIALGEQQLSGRHILISAGGTSERIDPVRTLTNRATGTLGATCATLAALSGANVHLVTTDPGHQSPIYRTTVVESASELANALQRAWPENDSLIMSAAVSDFTLEAGETKRRRSDALALELTPTQDIVAELATHKTPEQVIIGFCLGDADGLEELAISKLKTKKIDYIVANTKENIGAQARTFSIYNKSGKISEKLNVSVTESAHAILNCLRH
ncbi:MAG: bifunctional phosphopantothenoylcysteine decarboxylase/phosphopantothenate--cysteine ligase CoaBC [bacterium]|nr:bifunctional phosphopantothenoylcysteine decarboxylase/phosphopantothenate--cysteine ligase CoaBC [bacterium]